MGYTTEFDGELKLTPALTMEQYAELCALHDDESSKLGAATVKSPGGYCQWVPTKNGKGLKWDDGEKFYDYTAWMQYICSALEVWGVKANGEIRWNGEERGDIGTITVTDNKVVAEKGSIVPKGKNKLDIATKALEKIAESEELDVAISIATETVVALKKMKETK